MKIVATATLAVYFFLIMMKFLKKKHVFSLKSFFFLFEEKIYIKLIELRVKFNSTAFIYKIFSIISKIVITSNLYDHFADLNKKIHYFPVKIKFLFQKVIWKL